MRFFKLTKTFRNKLHINITLNDDNANKAFELSLEALQLLSLDIKSLSFTLETKSNELIEEILKEEFPYFFLDYLQDVDSLEVFVPHDEFSLIPSVFDTFKNLKSLKMLKLVFYATNYFHLPYQHLLTIPLMDDFFQNFLNLHSLETNLYFLGSLMLIYPKLTHLTVEISHTGLQKDLLSKIQHFPNLISLEIYLVDDQTIINFFSYQTLIDLKETLQNLHRLTEMKIIQGVPQIILDNKRSKGLKEFIRELIERPYLIGIEAEALDQIEIIQFQNQDYNMAKNFYNFLQKQVILQRVRFLSIIQAFQHSKLSKTFKRQQILIEIFNFLI